MQSENFQIHDKGGAHLLFVKLLMKLCVLSMLLLTIASPALAKDIDVQLEGGGVWFSRNDVRTPGNGGTKFDMLDLTGKGPYPYMRLYATHYINDKHALRLTLAPLEVSGTGRLLEDVTFNDDVFTAAAPTKGIYKFNTYRLTYRWLFYDRENWRWGIGAAALVRDASITLEQGNKRQSKDDLGLVPLLHLYGEYRVNDQAAVIWDMEGAWSPMGRAVDASLTAKYDFDSGWYIMAGYRTLEGGADNDAAYTFAWLHYAQATVGYRF
ncbi:MAG: hypothetical protein K9K75_01655 [Deltaproteobacteria bacterium]|nr:hypothetical protein [Deltaproteobacteria bacterium]